MKTNDIAKQILKKYWDKNLPVNLTKLAADLKASVIPDPKLDVGGISGQFALEKDGAVIRFNPHEPPVRQRFTIAHELGHYVLGHGDKFRDPLRNFSTSNYDPNEVAANRFAGAILMPEIAVEYWVISQGITDLRTLAEKFDVSEVAMQYRLKNLGLISS